MSEFTFLYPLWLTALIPWALLIIWLNKRQRSQTLIAPHLAKAMGLQGNHSGSHLTTFAGISGVLAILALSGPSFSSQERPSFTNTSTRVIVMDMSMSMYATDIKPNRLTQARYKVTDLLNSWNEGNTGLVAYAGDAYIVSPLTSDTSTIVNLVPSLSPEIMPYPGANAAKGVELAVQMMQNTGAGTGNIVLITDDLDDTELADVRSLLSGSNWQLTLLGIGSRSGAPIQLADGTLLTMDNGQRVVAKSNFSNMQSLASAVNGQFIPVQLTNNDIKQIVKLTSQVDDARSASSNQKVANRINQGYWLLPLLLVPALFMFRKGVLFSGILAVLLPFTAPSPAHANPWLNADQQAKQHYDAKEYDKAAALFSNSEWKGIAQYQAGDYQEAIESLKGSTSPNGRYNLANAYAQAGDLERAIELYEDVLKHEPDNEDAKKNLELVKAAQQQQQQQQGDSDQSGDQKKSENGEQSSSPQNGQNQNQSNNTEQNQSESNERADNAEKESRQNGKNDPDSSEEQQTNAQAHKSEQAENSEQTPALNAEKQDNQQQIDPELRKLEQVESARDPSRLLRAQLFLQAQQKQPPQQAGKKW